MCEVIKTGKTVEEATALALAELGLTEDEVTIEVLELPQKKLFRTIPAKVRVMMDEPIAVQLAAAVATPVAKPAAPKAAPAPVIANSPVKTAPPVDTSLTPVDLASAPKVQEALEYLQDICTKMGIANLTITAFHQGEAVVLKLDGEDAGNLIGHRGEVMESLSYLTGLVGNRSGGDYLKINLDINQYRSKRESNLTALAHRIGTKVAKTGRSHTLEPMNPYERRIIHSAIGEIENVKSESTGEGGNRRVVIRCTGENAQADRPFRQAGRGPIAPSAGASSTNRGSRPSGGNFSRPQGGSAGAGRSGDFKRPAGNFNRNADGPRPQTSNVPTREFADRPRNADAAPMVPQRTETVNDGENMPLYGKIEL